jgi:hypothetical protein
MAPIRTKQSDSKQSDGKQSDGKQSDSKATRETKIQRAWLEEHVTKPDNLALPAKAQIVVTVDSPNFGRWCSSVCALPSHCTNGTLMIAN